MGSILDCTADPGADEVDLSQHPGKINKPFHALSIKELAHNVKFLADGFCAVVWGYIGDLDYFVQFLNFADAQGMEPCRLCPCTNRGGDVPHGPTFEVARQQSSSWK